MAASEKVLIALPLLAIAGVVGIGWWATGTLGREASDLAAQRVSPLVERDFPRMTAETGARRYLLEAECDLNQAIITEKLALSADEDALPALAKDNAANIAEARERIGKAMQLVGLEGSEGHRALMADFDAWTKATTGVIAKAGDPAQHKFAIRASEGSAADAFAAIIKQIQTQVAARGAAVDAIRQQVEGIGKAAVIDAAAVATDAQRMRLLIAGLGTAALLLAAVSLWLSSRKTARALASAAVRQAEAERGQAALTELFRLVAGKADSLSAAASELRTVGARLDENAGRNASESQGAAAAAEEVSRNVQTVAAAAEQMSASIREISGQASGASKIGDEATHAASEAQTVVGRLGESSARIGEMVSSITGIAEQTNLLALNATIEAARAGDAGRGFAVVANEVKELARQTRQATEEIQTRAVQIGTDVQGAVAAMTRVGDIIGQIVQSLTAIAAAVEQQSATTTEISRNVGEAAKGASEIAQSVSGLAERSQAGTTDAATVARQAATAAGLAGELTAAVKR